MRKGVFRVFSFIIWKKAETQKPVLPNDTDADIARILSNTLTALLEVCTRSIWMSAFVDFTSYYSFFCLAGLAENFLSLLGKFVHSSRFYSVSLLLRKR